MNASLNEGRKTEMKDGKEQEGRIEVFVYKSHFEVYISFIHWVLHWNKGAQQIDLLPTVWLHSSLHQHRRILLEPPEFFRCLHETIG